MKVWEQSLLSYRPINACFLLANLRGAQPAYAGRPSAHGDGAQRQKPGSLLPPAASERPL